MSFLRRLPLLAALLLCAVASAARPLPPPEPGKLTVYFLDVGQGDAALIVSPEGKTVLVDGGPPDSAQSLTEKLRSILKGPLDLVVLTHPHLDHLGGLAQVIEKVGAKNFMDPGFDHGTSSYEKLLRTLQRKDVAYVEPSAEGDEPFVLGVGGDASMSVFWPRRPKEPFLSGTRSDANANSVVFRLTFGRTAFLFMGDAEDDTEQKLLRSGFRLHATVLKVPHHGSRHSSAASLIARVSPKAAVISCGAGNDYGHPHQETLRRYQNAGARVFRTDELGDVRAVSDGTTVTVEGLGAGESRAVATFTGAEPPQPVALQLPPPPEQRETTPLPDREVRTEVPKADVVPASTTGAPYAASRKSQVFHRSDCASVGRISRQNLQYFDDRASAAKSRRPAGDCHP